jgi:hypothetical protein
MGTGRQAWQEPSRRTSPLGRTPLAPRPIPFHSRFHFHFHFHLHLFTSRPPSFPHHGHAAVARHLPTLQFRRPCTWAPPVNLLHFPAPIFSLVPPRPNTLVHFLLLDDFTLKHLRTSLKAALLRTPRRANRHCDATPSVTSKHTNADSVLSHLPRLPTRPRMTIARFRLSSHPRITIHLWPWCQPLALLLQARTAIMLALEAHQPSAHPQPKPRRSRSQRSTRTATTPRIPKPLSAR